MQPSAQIRWRWVLAVFFAGAGLNHFLHPGPYLAMMPEYLPWHAELVAISGVAEMVGGVMLLFRPLRRIAAWGLIALLLAVFPANLNVALHGWPSVTLPPWSLWARLPLQLLLIWWVYRVSLDHPWEKNRNHKF